MLVLGDSDDTVKLSTYDESDMAGFEPAVASSTASSIYVTWLPHHGKGDVVKGFQVHYQKVASSYVQHSSLLPPTTTGYSIRNLVADTYYKVCVVMYRNNTSSLSQCIDASTTNWQIPVSIGSSIGAVLALSIIVLIVLLSRCPSRCPKFIRNPRRGASESSKYDSMSSHYHDDHLDLSDTTTHHDQSHEHEEATSPGPDAELGAAAMPDITSPPRKKTLHHQSSLGDPRMCNGSKNPPRRSGSCRHSQHYHHHHHHHPPAPAALHTVGATAPAGFPQGDATTLHHVGAAASSLRLLLLQNFGTAAPAGPWTSPAPVGVQSFSMPMMEQVASLPSLAIHEPSTSQIADEAV